jgi:hypothetical protein
MSSALLGNDGYKASLRQTWIASPADSTVQVTAIPSNLPTIVTLAWKQSNQTKLKVTGTSGDSPSNFALTGVEVLSGGLENLPEGTPVNCVVHEDFFNQYGKVVNDDFIRLNNRNTDADTPAAGKALFYLKNSAPFTINESGTITQVGFKSDQWINVADSATMNIDLSETVKKLKFLLGPLGGNRTLTLSNPSAGLTFMLRIMQDSVGSRLLTWFGVDPETVTITIANPGVVTTSHDMKTGTPVKFTSTGTLPTGITSGTIYYWIRAGATTGNLATSKANALAGTAIATSGSQSGVHTMSPQIIWAGGIAPTLTTTKFAYDDIGFIYHSPGQCTGTVISQDL